MSLNSHLEKNINLEGQRAVWSRRFDLIALAIWLGLSVWLAMVALLLYGVDFRGYFAASRVLLMGGNPYDYDQVAPVLLQITGEMGNNPYYYPPWFAWFFVPLAMLPFQIARAIWMIFNMILWLVGLWNLGNLVGWPPAGWKRYLFYSLATLSFAGITWRYEQAGILVFFLLVAVMISIEKQHWAWTGFWMALALIKPNITILVIAGISLWLVRRSHWRPVMLMMLWIALFLAISTFVTPDWYKPFFEEGFGQGLVQVWDGPERVVALRINTTILDWLRTLGAERWLQLQVYSLVLTVGLAVFLLTLRHSQSLLEVVSVGLLMSYALTPYAMQYDYPSLVIVILCALSVCSSSLKGLRIALLPAGFVFSVIFWQENISWGYWMVVGSVALVFCAWIIDKKTLLQRGSSV